MLRILIEFVGPLLLPTVLWLAWSFWRKSRHEPQTVPWVWLAGAGAFLAFVITWGGWLRAGTHDGTYSPPRIGSDGRLVPGHLDKPE